MIKNLFKNITRDYLTFTKSERNGVIILSFLILVSVIFKPEIRKLFSEYILNPGVKSDTLQLTSNIPELFNQVKDTTNNVSAITPTFKKVNKNAVTNNVKINIEINSADTLKLDEIPGIGKYLARNIVKYREKLGGYIKIEQLREVYGMHPDNFLKIAQYFYIDTTLVRKIDINTATFKEINSHPYITYQQTCEIFKYRNKGYKITPDVINNLNVDSPDIRKVIPYLVFNK